jgi:hypothetical protein
VKPAHFLAPILTNAMASATEPARRAILDVVRAQLAEVPCPRCGTVLAVWAASTGCLYRVAEDGKLGLPLSTDRRERVPVACDRCDRAWHTSGRGVGRALHNGRPPLT